MTLLRWIVLVALVAAISFKIVFPTYHYRYRMTVEIEANGQVHTGTGVIGVSAVNQTALEGLLASFDMNYWGQAPVVDLGKDGVIVAILRPTGFPPSYQPPPAYPDNIAMSAYYGLEWGVPHSDVARNFRNLHNQTGQRTLEPSRYPCFVWLPNPENPATARPVMPTVFSKVIAPSVRLRSVKVEITTDRNNNEIFKKLPWLSEMREEERKKPVRVPREPYELKAQYLLGE